MKSITQRDFYLAEENHKKKITTMVRRFQNMKTGEIITYSQFKMLEYPEHYNYRELYNSSENDTNLNFFKKNEKNSDDLLHKKKT